MLNKNTLGVKKVRGQSEAALQTGATKNFDISWGQEVTYQNLFHYSTAHFKLDTRVCAHACMHTFNACKSK